MALVMGYLHAYYTYTNNTGAKMSFLARKKGVQKLVWTDGWNEVQNVHKGKDLKPYTKTNCRKWPCENRSSWWDEMAELLLVNVVCSYS
jgi:hypothetical protein